MASVRFNLKRTGARRVTAIVAVARHEGKRSTYYTGQSIDPAEWDAKRERSRKCEDMNKALADIRKKILEFIDAAKMLPGREVLERKPTFVRDRYTIFEAIAQKGKEVKQVRQGKTSDRAYITLSSNLKRFHAETGRQEVFLDEIGIEYISDFNQFLNDLNRTVSTISKNIFILTSTLQRFGNPEQYRGIRTPKARYTDQTYLNPEEIARIEALELKGGMATCRDLFLCGYYTALRSCDWNQIRTGQIEVIDGIKVLKITQQKTKDKAVIPVHPKLWEILMRHGGHVKMYSIQYFNRDIKKIALKAGITEMVSITEYRKGRVVISEKRKCDLISSHTARRSFATNAVNSGIPATDAMRFTGHRTMSAFQQYVRTSKEETALQYSNHPFFGGNPTK